MEAELGDLFVDKRHLTAPPFAVGRSGLGKSFVVGRSLIKDSLQFSVKPSRFGLANASPPIRSQMDAAQPEILDCITTMCYLS